MSARSDDMPLWASVGLLVVVLVVWGLIHHHWVSDCEARGGHWRDVSRSGICIGPDGRIMP